MISPKRLVPGTLLTASLTTLYTVPSSVLSATAKQMLICNTDTSARTVTVNVVPANGTASPANTIFDAISLQPKETKIFGLTDVLAVGGFIQAKADVTDKVAITVSGMENT